MRGRSLILWLSVGLLSLAILIWAVVVAREAIARLFVLSVFDRAGIQVRSLDVAAVGLEGLRVENVAIGQSEGLSAAAVDISWTAETLRQGHVDRIAVHQPQISLIYRDGRFSIEGLPFDPAEGGDDPAPFRRLEVTDARLSLAAPWGRATATGDGRIVSSPEGELTVARIEVESAETELAGGRLFLSDLVFEPDKPLDTTLHVENVDLEALLALIDVEGLSGSGSLSGEIPIHVDGEGLRVSGGMLTAAEPGVIRYTGAGLPADATAMDNQAAESVSLARDALADFHYTGLTLGLNRTASGDGTLTVKLEGANPRVLDGHPFVFNIRLEANFDTLAEILLEGYAMAEQLLRDASGP